MRTGVSIVSTALVSPLGLTQQATVRALLAGEFIKTHSRCPVEFSPGLSRLEELAFAAASDAIATARWSSGQLFEDRTALVVGTSKGPIESWIELANGTHHRSEAPGCFDFGLSQISTQLARRLGLGFGPRETLSAACASGLDALIRAAMMIQHGQVDRAIVVACESSLHPIFLGSFARLGVIPRDGVGCRPFDEGRDGFLMSESAAALCLVRSSEPSARGKVCIDAFHLAGDATHLTGADPAGETMIYSLQRSWPNDEVDLIHAHGTGTPSHDPIELRCIQSVSRRKGCAPAIYSHKGALGHSLGAAGLVATVLNVWMHENQLVLPNVRTINPIACDGIMISQATLPRRIKQSLVLAAGFGGATAVVGLSSK